MSTHIKVLGWLHLIFGAFGVLGAIALFGGTMLGGLFTGSIGGFIGVSMIGGFVAVILACLSLPMLLAGYGLLKRRPWARILTLVIAVFHLLHFPVGTIMSIYAAWVLLSAEGAREFATN